MSDLTPARTALHILLTGADGFTGRHFARWAQAQGWSVVALRADLCDTAAVAAEVAALGSGAQERVPDAVLHLAAISYVAHGQPLQLYGVNVLGTEHLLQALCRWPVPPQRVLLASSANVYGNAPASPIAETQAPAPVNHYAISKLAMELMARPYAAQLPLVWARPFNYTGPGQGEQFLLPKLVRHFHERRPRLELGNTAVEREFNDVRMVCEAYGRLLLRGEPGQTYNVCSGQPWALTAVLALLEQLTGHTAEVVVNPALVRPHEVLRLCGDPARLHACVGPLPQPALAETLGWMLAEVAGRSST